MKDKFGDSNTNKSISEVSLTQGASLTPEKGSLIDLSAASLSLEGVAIGVSLDEKTSTKIKIGAN